MLTIASAPEPFSETRRPIARISASGTRSTAATVSPAAADRGDEAGDHLAVRRREQHPLHLRGWRAVGAGLPDREVLQHLEVHHRFLERDRDQLLGLEAQRAGHVLLGHDREIDGAHEHAGARDTDPDLGPFLRLSSFQSRWIAAVTEAAVDDLAVAHRLGRERDLAEGRDARQVSGGFELDDANRVRPDVESDQAAGHVPPFLAVPGGVHHAVVEERRDVIATDAEVLADADGAELARLDEAVHRHRRHPHDLSNLTGSQEVIRDCGRHAHLSSTGFSTVSVSVNNRQHGPQRLSDAPKKFYGARESGARPPTRRTSRGVRKGPLRAR